MYYGDVYTARKGKFIPNLPYLFCLDYLRTVDRIEIQNVLLYKLEVKMNFRTK